MIKLKRKSFGLIDRLKGNIEFRNKLLENLKFGNNIDFETPKELPKDLRKYMTFLINNGCENNKTTFSNPDGVVFSVFSYNTLIDQYYNKKVPFGVRSVDNRIVLMQTKNFVIDYSIDKKVYELWEEANSMDLLTRGVNKLFGVSKKPIYVSNSLLDIINYTLSSLSRVIY